MKILRMLEANGCVLCSDTARTNRGEVYYYNPDCSYSLMPCVYLHIKSNSRTVSRELYKLCDRFGVAFHLANETLALLDATPTRIYSEDRAIIAGSTLSFEQLTWESIEAFTLYESHNDITQTAKPPSYKYLETRLQALCEWMTLNVGDWLLFPLLDTPLPFRFPTRVMLSMDETLLLDELLRA
ncbi:MAG: hypothetical protein ACTTKZ_05180 [Bacteroides sp.]